MVQTIGILNGEVDAVQAIQETETELIIPAIFTREGVLSYPKGKMFRPAEEIREALFTLNKAYVVTEKHPEPLISIVTDRRDIKGEVSDVTFDVDAVDPLGRKSPAARGIVHLRKKGLSQTFIDDIKSGKLRDVSAGFLYDTEVKSGEWNGEKYDFIQRNLLINHIAVGVPIGRVRAPFIGLGCDAVDFEVEVPDLAEKPTDIVSPPSLAQTVASPAQPIITLPTSTEDTVSLVTKINRAKTERASIFKQT
jgi:hypothetical protein